MTAHAATVLQAALAACLAKVAHSVFGGGQHSAADEAAALGHLQALLRDARDNWLWARVAAMAAPDISAEVGSMHFRGWRIDGQAEAVLERHEKCCWEHACMPLTVLPEGCSIQSNGPLEGGFGGTGDCK